MRSQTGESSLLTKLKTPSRSYYGMHLAHIGVAVFIAGVSVVTNYQTEKDVKMNIGDTVSVGGYDFRLNNLAQYQGPNYRAVRADMEVTRNGSPVAVMHPEKRAFTASQNVTSETAIDRSVFRDLYLSLGDEAPGGGWTVRVYHKPLVNWIWGGALLMALGGGLAVSDRRYALAARKFTSQTSPGKPEPIAKVVTAATSAAE